MKIILLLVYYELKKYRQDLLTVLLVVISPPLFLLLMAHASGALEEEHGLGMPFPVGVVNLDARPEAEAVVFFLMDNEELKELFYFTLFEESDNNAEAVKIPDAALEALESDKLAAIVMIPEGFSQAVARGGSMDLQFMGNYRRPLASAYTEAMLTSGAKLVTAAQSGVNTVHHFLREAGVPRSRIGETVHMSYLSFFLHAMGRKEVLATETVSPWGPVTPVEYYSVSLIIFFLMLGGMTVLRAEEGAKGERGGHTDGSSSTGKFGAPAAPSAGEGANSAGMAARLKSCGISSTHLTTASFLSALLFLALQAAVLFSLFAVFAEGFFRGDPLAIVIVTAAFIAAVAGLLVLVSALARGGANANIIWFFIIIFMAIAGGGLIPMTLLPQWMEPLQQLSLFKWAGDGLYQSLFALSGNHMATISTAVMLTVAALSLTVAALKNRQ